MVVDLTWVRGAVSAHEAEDGLDPFSLRGGPSAEAGARMHECMDGACHESIVDENVLLELERRVAPFQVASPVAHNPMPQRQVLRAGRGPYRVRLHEAEPAHGLLERGPRKEAARHGVPAQLAERL